MPSPERTAAEEALGKPAVKAIWTVNYEPALPFTLQDFDVGALLPTMIYMSRRGHRRGKGRFVETFRPAGVTRLPTVADVAEKLAGDVERFANFDAGVGPEILADLLLCHCLENKKHDRGRDKQVQRAFATHYFASHLDLPRDANALRYVPDMLVAALARQEGGEHLEPGGPERSFFPVGVVPDRNLLMELIDTGVTTEGPSSGLTADRFDEAADVGIDQLLTVRLAQACGSAPEKVAGKSNPRIPNQRPLCESAADALNEDLRLFIMAYGEAVPRQALLPMLEAAIALNLTNLLLSTLQMLMRWRRDGVVTPKNEQKPWPIFIDCSIGVDYELRRAAEASFDHCHRALGTLPVTLMGLRLTQHSASMDIKLKGKLPSPLPHGGEMLSLLGDIAFDRHDRSERTEERFAEWCVALADQLQKADLQPDSVDLLRREEDGYVWRLADALVALIGDKQQFGHLRKCLDSCMMLNATHGLAASRRASTGAATGSKTRDARSALLSNEALDFLVHRHLRKPGKNGRTKPSDLSLPNFLELLRDRYGLCIDEAPPGTAVAGELLRRNRRTLERRLRDLGLLVGVNDAESMKRLRPRFPAAGDASPAGGEGSTNE
jgi:hypothetical protein